MLDLTRRLTDWLRFLRFRIKRARAIRRAKKDDSHIYPLW